MAAKEEEKEMEVGKDLAAGKEEVMGEEKEEGGEGGGGKGGGGGEGGEGGGEGAIHVLSIVSHELAGPEVSHVYFARNAVAPENIKLCAVVAAVPVHEEMSWLNAEA